MIDNVGGITVSMMVVVTIFVIFSQMMLSFAGLAPSEAETEINELYTDIKDVCENPATSQDGTLKFSEGLGGGQIKVCDSNSDKLCYKDKSYGSGMIACDSITLCGGSSMEANTVYKVTVENDVAQVECEESGS